jgi:ATP-dependent exoDNAse (exonuclease V) alpha subunit
VARENFECLKALNKKMYMSEAEYKGKGYDVEILKKECPAEHELYFCEGAQIIMLTNDFEGRWVNGSLGIIQKADPVLIKLYNGNTIKPTLNTWQRIEYKVGLNGKLTTSVIAEMEQMPWKIGYSSSIHKSQGLTLEYVDLDLENTFACGMAYVALSRVKSLAGLKVRGWKKEVVKADPMIKKFYGV